MPPRRSRENKENEPPAPKAQKTTRSRPRATLASTSTSTPSYASSVPFSQPALQPKPFAVFTEDTANDDTIISEKLVPDIVTRCSITDHDLFSDLSSNEVRELVERIMPDLGDEDVQNFFDTTYNHACASPPFTIPQREREPTTWPSTYPDMDAMWDQAVEAERAIELPTRAQMPRWLNMAEGNLVKFTGSLKDTLLIVSSYPTARIGSTVHPTYGTTLDLPNVSMFMLYAKLGHHVASLRKHGALHLNIFPRRVDRKLVPTGQGVLEKVPVKLRQHWKSVVHELIKRSEARVALLVGAAGIASYVAYLEENKIRNKSLWPSSSKNHLHHTEPPSAWIEYDDNNNEIKRVAFAVPHPEYFNRVWGTVITDKVRGNAIKERLVDYAMVMLWKDTHLQSFLSTTRYRFQSTTGVTVKMSDLEDYGETNKTLRKLLSIPNLSNFTLNVLLNKNENVSEEQAQAIKALRKKMNIKLTDHPSYWDRPDVIQEYGNHALTFKMIAERREGPTQSSKPKQQPLSLSLYQIEGNPFLERYNTTVTDLLNKEKVKSNQIARNKRKRAVEIAGKEEDSVEEEI